MSIAKKYNGEIISADSRQIYRRLDIGSGAVTKKEMAGVRHHLLNVASPRRIVTAADFVVRSRRVISKIARRGAIPIIAGGTAFWIDALVYDLSLPAVKPDGALRRMLEKKSSVELFVILKKLDMRRAAKIDQKNPRRLIRAIEIAAALGRVPKLKKCSPYQALWIGLKLSYEVQPHKIAKRTQRIIRQGLVAETKRLLAAGITKKRIHEFGFEYRAALDFVLRRIQRDQLPKRIIKDTLAYAKRQMTWWKRNPDIHWVKNGKEANRLLDAFTVPVKRQK